MFDRYSRRSSKSSLFFNATATPEIYTLSYTTLFRSDPEAEAERSLKRLGVDQVDLYIIHWPQGGATWAWPGMERSEEHTSELQSRENLVCRLLLEKKKRSGGIRSPPV